MKRYLKIFSNKSNLFVILIFILAAFVRFYNFPNRITFWSEQARSLIVSANYIKVKPSLLGQEYFRQDSNSHVIYSGAYFNYSLVPLLLISNYDPTVVTIFFALLNLLTGGVIYWAAKKMFNNKIAIISTILFLFNDLMIYHSLFIWNYNYLPLVGILIFYFSFLNLKKEHWKYILLLGFLSGVGISLQILFAVFALFVFIVNIWKCKNKITSSLLFSLGVALGNLPLVLFDLRHNFFQTNTILQYLIDTLLGKSDAGFAYYYLLPLWPVFAILGGLLVWRVFKWDKIIAIFAIVIYVMMNLISQKVSFKTPTGMPGNVTVLEVDTASKAISMDVSGPFNVSEVLDFDKRAYVFRYFLEFRYDKKPLSETEYQNIKLLYVLAPTNFDFKDSNTWEIKTGWPYVINNIHDIGNGYVIYKLQKP